MGCRSACVAHRTQTLRFFHMEALCRPKTAWESFGYLLGTAGLCSRAVGRNLAVLKPPLPSLGSEVAVFHTHSCSRKDARVAGVFGNALCRVSCAAFPVSPQEHPSAEHGL